MFVLKFGGASIKDAESIRQLKRILDSYNDKMVIVVSAMGKITNTLEKLCYSCFYSESDINTKFNLIKKYHFDIIDKLFPEKHKIFEIADSLFDKLNVSISTSGKADFDYEYDQIVSFGEIISTTIISEYLNLEKPFCRFCDIRDCLKTDRKYRQANIDWELSNKLIKEQFTFGDISKYITQGFIGGASDGSTVTLGREGSDYTAAIIANIMDAEKVVFWKDVPGILNADPEWFGDTVKLENISYREAIELSYYGAKVIHPNTIKPLENKQIPLTVKSFINPDDSGTVINANGESDELVPSFIFKTEQTLISIIPRDFSFIVEGNLSEIFGVFAQLGIKVNLMQTSAINFSICIDHNDEKIKKLISELDKNYKVFYNTGLELASIRHYDQTTIDLVTKDKVIYLEQKTRNMARFVMMQVNG